MPAAPLRRIADQLRTVPEEAVRAGATAANEKIEQQLRADTGGDAVLSGAGKVRKKLSTTTRVNGGVSLASALIKAGPAKALAQWTWLQRGVRAHDVGRRRDGKGGLHMNTGVGWKTGPFRHPGTPGKQTWSKGVAAGREAAQAAMTAVIRARVLR